MSAAKEELQRQKEKTIAVQLKLERMVVTGSGLGIGASDLTGRASSRSPIRGSTAERGSSINNPRSYYAADSAVGTERVDREALPRFVRDLNAELREFKKREGDFARYNLNRI